jgi:hypothetical protein
LPDIETMTHIRLKAAFWICLVVAILVLLWHFRLADQYVMQGALQPDPASGRVVAFHNHALVVYVTSRENLIAQGSICAFFGLLFLAGWLSQTLGWKSPFDQRSSPPFWPLPH